MPHNAKNTAKVQITETPDGLELRSTSWYEIDEKMKELSENKLIEKGYLFGGIPAETYIGAEYKFVEDYSEVKQIRVNEIDRQVKQIVEHVIILKKRDNIDKSE